jgi:hypothetical protein
MRDESFARKTAAKSHFKKQSKIILEETRFPA